MQFLKFPSISYSFRRLCIFYFHLRSTKALFKRSLNVKAIHLLVKAPEQEEKLAGIRLQKPFLAALLFIKNE